MSLTLWGAGTGRTMRGHWALAELGVDYESKPILPRTGETLTPEYTALNPRQKIPLLQDGGFTLGESAAIVIYLAETYSSASRDLLPPKGCHRHHWFEWAFFIVTELDSSSLYVMRRHGTVQGLAHIYGEAPGVVARAAEYFQRQLRHVDIALRDGRPFLMGERFTAVDILLTTCLKWARDYEIEMPPHLISYLEGNMARPAYESARLANMVRDIAM
ncbi:glutathione S-transferase family protein [Seohaeicola saemankumensis]|uniref:glutathione S-transferase family protein n=1 Tax=Seohaeicola TaxID=481178 RepID=UPI0035CEDDFD